MTSQQQNHSKIKSLKLPQNQHSKSHIYACFQQPQTIDILKYLTMPTPYKLQFDSAGVKNNTGKSAENQESNSVVKKVKQFRFQRIYNRQEKFKFAFSEEISYIIEKLFKGFNQTVFIYGTQESKKDKILIGQSQNSGFLLTTLAQIFEYCHERQIQDEVTIKISCSIFKQGKFSDPFSQGNFSNKQKRDTSNNAAQNKKQQNDANNSKADNSVTNTTDQQQQTMVCDDLLQNKYLLGTPQVIVRNMRTALKIINLLTKKISQRRQSHQQSTQNIIFTIKLQIDIAYDRETTGQVYQYAIPKLYIVKLGNPSINNTLNGINKSNRWFINMFNFLQSEVLENKGALEKRIYEKNGGNGNVIPAPQKQLAEILSANGVNTTDNGMILLMDQQKDDFTQFIKTVVMQGVADIHSFTSLTNKMTSNECLTAFIFNNYLSSFQTKPKKTFLNIYKMRNEKANYQDQLLNLFTFRQTEVNKEKQFMEKYRVKYGIRYGEWEKGKVLSIGNNKVDKDTIRIKDNVSVKKDTTSNSQSLKKASHSQTRSPTSSTMTNPKLDSSFIKQSIKAILSLSCDDEGQVQSIQWELKIFFLKYIESIRQFMNCCNIVEYEYAQVLSQGCEKLSKYIFNQEVQEFFYAKKISLQQSQDLKIALKLLKTQKVKLQQMQQRMLKKITQYIKSVNNQLQILKEINGRQQHQQLFKIKKNKLTTLIRQRDMVEKIFQYYSTMSFHYIYQDNTKFISQLENSKKKIELEFEKRNNSDTKVNYEQIMKNIKKGFNKRISEKRDFKSPQKDIQKSQENELKQEENQDDFQVSDNSKIYDSSNQKQMNDKNTSKQVDNRILNQRDSATSQKQNKHNSPTNKLQQITQKALKYKMKKKQDQLNNMFTNSNVGVVRPQFHKRNK